MTTPEGPHGHPAEQPADRPAWGQQPAGGWGDAAADPERDTEAPAWAGRDSRADSEAPARRDQPAWGDQPTWGDQPAWGSQPEQPSAWGPPASQQPAWGGAPEGQPSQGPSPQGPSPQWPNAQGASPQAPAWAQQPPPGGGWGGGQQAPGGWAGQPAPWPGGPQQGGSQRGGQQPWRPLPPAFGGSPQQPPRTPLIVGGAVAAVLALVAFLAFVAPGFLRSTVFDQAALQGGVQRVLVESYRLGGVGDVVCGDPAQGPIPVRRGEVFTCATTVDGAPVTVSVTITSDGGDYEVARPDI